MRRTFVSLILLSAAAAPAWGKEALKIELVPKAQEGQGQPELVVRAEVSIAKIVLDAERSSDRKRIRVMAGPIAAGREHRFPLELKKPGRASFRGTLSVELDNGETGQMPIDVSAELLEMLSIVVLAEDVDLERRTLRLTANRGVKRVEVSAMSDTGTPLGTEGTDVSEHRDAEGKYVARWKQASGTVLRISVKAWDDDGFYGGVDLFPWRVDIPHEEVNFRTGSFDIEVSEGPKLEASYRSIDGAIQKFGKLATIRLFIAGHTDTVGDRGSNQVLSNHRARSIGRWFRKRGVSIPVLYAGFGEDLLAVKTPDETDEAKNRRAEYIVAVDPPPMGAGARFAPLD